MRKTIHITAADDLQRVFDEAAEGSTIFLGPGVYRQKIMLRTNGLTIEGTGVDKVKLVYDDHANKPHPIGGEYNTFRTYTLAVCADRVTIRNITIENDALFPETKGQEVALSVVGDDFRMENCRLSSTQDTLFVGPLPSDLIGRYEGAFDDALCHGKRMRQRFENCLIEGTVDFIFGCGEAVFQRCRIHSLVDARNIGYVAAPAHEQRQTEGFVFRDCDFTCQDGVTPESIYLARPWRDYGMASFENCRYANHIKTEGFHKWSGTDRDRTARFYESPALPGRVDWINRK